MLAQDLFRVSAFIIGKKMYLFPRVTVHDKVTRALCDEFGLDVQPSTATNIALQQVRKDDCSYHITFDQIINDISAY